MGDRKLYLLKLNSNVVEVTLEVSLLFTACAAIAGGCPKLPIHPARFNEHKLKQLSAKVVLFLVTSLWKPSDFGQMSQFSTVHSHV